MDLQQKSFSRRTFLSLSATALAIPVIGTLPRLKKGTTARLKISYSGKSLGLKISEHKRGQLILSVRQIGGAKLLAFNLGMPKTKGIKAGVSSDFKLKNGKPFRVAINQLGLVSSSISAVKFSRLDYQTDNNQPTGQGFFDWVGDLVKDAAAAIGAAITWLLDGEGDFYLSGGGNIFVDGWGGIEFTGGKFKLEPGIEEDPLIWY